jgi:hypothetical protein
MLRMIPDIAAENREVLQTEILNHVAHGSKIYTDETRVGALDHLRRANSAA